MTEIDTIRGSSFIRAGEIDRSDLWKGNEGIPPDVWPGRFSDIESLERNAALYREDERRRFFRLVRAHPAGFFRQVAVRFVEVFTRQGFAGRHMYRK